MSKIDGYLRLARLPNCLMMGIAVIIGAALANPKDFSASWANLIYGFVTGFTLTAASMSINDYSDRGIDAVNEPNRPIPSGLIRPYEAVAFATILTLVGLLAALSTNLSCFLVAAFSWIGLISYVTVGKRTGLPGNFLVSACVAAPFVYGSIAIAEEIRWSALFFALLAFLSNTGREITKGIIDVEGDRLQNVKTLAVRYGDKAAAFSAVCFYLAAASLSPIPWLLGLVSFWFVPFVAMTDAGLIASSIMLLRDSSRENARKIKTYILLWFVFALVALLVGVLL